MKKLLPILLGIGLYLIGVTIALASTPEDATALVKKAVALVKQEGKERAIAAFNNPRGDFVKGDLYIFVVDMHGTTLANGTNSKLVGKSVINMMDADGKFFIKNFIDIAQTKGSGWSEYLWPDPVTRVIRPKTTYIEKVDDIMIGCGIYK
jgi:cytochrome c